MISTKIASVIDILNSCRLLADSGSQRLAVASCPFAVAKGSLPNNKLIFLVLVRMLNNYESWVNIIIETTMIMCNICHYVTQSRKFVYIIVYVLSFFFCFCLVTLPS